jgi:hypothetical protein
LNKHQNHPRTDRVQPLFDGVGWRWMYVTQGRTLSGARFETEVDARRAMERDDARCARRAAVRLAAEQVKL